jgi:hypothetical protein
VLVRKHIPGFATDHSWVEVSSFAKIFQTVVCQGRKKKHIDRQILVSQKGHPRIELGTSRTLVAEVCLFLKIFYP